MMITNSWLPHFLAVATPIDDPACLMALTPRVMRWSDDVWLMDLSVCRSYWQANAQRLNKQPLVLIQTILERTLATADQPLCAALADHPWPAILVLGAMRERRLTGFMQLETPFTQALYRDIIWSGWMAAAGVIAVHFANRKTLPFNGAQYQRQCKQLVAAARRLRLASPWELRTAAALSVRRRFGQTLAALWEWTFPPSQSPHAQAEALAAFPWQRWEWTEKPRVLRVLDYALWQWEAIAPLLCEDLDKLCRVRLSSRGFEGKVTELTWLLTLNDLRVLPVTVSFRHPHDLARELGQHKTALLQAQYAFEAALKAHQRADDNDIEVPIISWTLTMESCLATPPVISDLFGALADEGCEAARLLELENQLPVALAQFDLRQDWLPENSFGDQPRPPSEKPAKPLKDSWAAYREQPYELSAADTALISEAPREVVANLVMPSFWEAADDYLEASSPKKGSALNLVPPVEDAVTLQDFPWLAVARQRPLFLYAEPEPLDSCGHSSGRVFIERTSTKWWRAATDQGEHRDYYRLFDRTQRSSWVFQDSSGRWFVHGVFA